LIKELRLAGVKSSAMPEGPEVRTVTDYLADQLVGKEIVRIRCPDHDKFFRINGKRGCSTFQTLTNHLPAIIEKLFCKGKCIFFKLKSLSEEHNGVQFYLYCHLIMTGRWTSLTNVLRIINEPGTGMRTGSGAPKLTMLFGSHYQLGKLKIAQIMERIDYLDPRGLGRFEYMTEIEMTRKLNSLGPDILSDDIEWHQWRSITERYPRRQLVSLLMDQQCISGIGNYLKAEILYRSKLKPDRKVGSLTEMENRTLFQQSIATIRESYSYGGLTIRNFWHPNGKAGTFPIEIYGKSMDPLGNRVHTGTFSDGRTTHWVPTIQI
jgi:formamidopyrimidine-DNA glycosylase